MQDRRQQGFTLVEVMIVLVIVGILAAVALPAYYVYSVRSKMAEPLARASGATTEVTAWFSTNGVLPVTGATDVFNTAAAGSIQSMSWLRTTPSAGYVIVTINTDVATGGIPELEGNNQLGVFGEYDGNSGQMLWTCGEAAQTTVPSRYLPASCK